MCEGIHSNCVKNFKPLDCILYFFDVLTKPWNLRVLRKILNSSVFKCGGSYDSGQCNDDEKKSRVC